MINISNYKTKETIHESERSLVYRARHLIDNQPVILKILKQAYPPPERIAQFQREYEITNSLDIPGAVKVDRIIETEDHRWAMVVEDFGGLSLKKIAQNQQLTLDEFLLAAIKVAEIIGKVHQRQVIHKDINPSNIVWNQKTKEIKIIDFGISTKLSRETTTFRNPNLLEGTLAYISPEQTGRMNREIDYRSDFYSLGVTFYELLVGQLPFETTDSMELVHSHIAKQPTPPHEKNSEIPVAVSQIIMKLMAKTAEERYQSAWGLKADLETCLQELQTSGRISEFLVGSRDISDKFQITQKLYGRQEQVEQLLTSFDRVSEGAAEMILVAGYSGIGKSALVNEIHKPITRQKGDFIAGKFDQFKRDIPYAALIQAFQGLMRQLLTESETQLQLWRQKLLEALGSNGQVIADVIPEVELIIGKQPSVPQLGPTESQNRFNFVFQNFIDVFTQKEHPLVIFIDDLQWADLASLKLLELLMSDRDRQYLLLVGAYRDNEVSPAHPLIQTLQRIQEEKATVSTIALDPLGLDWVNRLIADTLKCSIEESQPLAKLAFEKTNGNPFFLTQLLQSLYTENLLSFAPSSARWQWDMEQINRVGITDNVVDLMVSKIEKLEEKTQNVLKLAACIGNQFDLAILSVVNGKSMSDTAADLWPALEQGLIIPLSDAYKLLILSNEEALVQSEETSSISIPYKFLHDRVQQAAYALIPEVQKRQVHLQIGQLLRQNTKTDELEEKIFDLVNQFNIGADLISTVSERNELARFNLIAGKKAKASTAYQAAANYLKKGVELLTPDSWGDEYDLTLALYVEAVGAEYLNAKFEEAERLAAIVLEKARNALDKVEVYEIKIQSYRSQSQLERAIDVALEISAQLGLSLPKQPSQEEINHKKQAVDALLKDKQIKNLARLPEMTNPHKLAILRILFNIFTSAFMGNPPLYKLLTLIFVDYSVTSGNSDMSIAGYAHYGVFLAKIGELESAYNFGKLSLDLLDIRKVVQLKSLTLQSFCVCVKHWRKHIKDTFYVLEGLNIGIENGDLEYGGYCAFTYIIHSLFAGKNLSKLEEECAHYKNLISRYKQGFTVTAFNMIEQLVVTLIGKVEDKENFIGEAFDERAVIPILEETKNYTTLCYLYTYKSIILYTFKKLNKALESAKLSSKYEDATRGMMCCAISNFYNSLSHLAVYSQASSDARIQYLKQVTANQRDMKLWAENAPANYQHKYDLVVAEKARVVGNNGRAREYYDRAIEGAKKNGFINEEAIAYERGAEFYFAIGREEIGRLYMKNAHYAYQRWGAVAKVEDLEAEYPELFRSTTPSTGTALTISNSGTSSGDALDLATVIKSTNAISSEIVLENLLATLMNILVENAGAERGILILPREEKLLVEATKETALDSVAVLQLIPVEEFARLSLKVVHYVARTLQTIVLSDAQNEKNFADDQYIKQNKCQSIACTPLINQNKLQGIIYLENNLTTGAFTQDRMQLLRTLATQAAISLENAHLYTQLEDYSRSLEVKVEERTAELAAATEEAQSANKAKSSFIANMSHELRSPLNAILGFSQLMLRSRGLSKEYAENLGIITRSGEHLLTLINNVLDLSKIESGKTTLNEKNFDLYRLLDDIEDMFGLKAKEKSLQLACDRSPEVPRYIRTDAVKLRQVLINLLNNALKFTKDGGVSVGATVAEDRGNERVAIHFEIADTGAGIAPEEIDSLFEAFVQTSTGKQAQEGTGLGLPISRQFVQLMGGDMGVRSQVGKGTVFYFDIVVPRVEGADIESSKPTRQIIALAPNQPRYRILIVDDKPINRKLLIELLNPLGFELKEASNGQEAVEIFSEWEPHLIWMDMRMPVMDGYEATRAIKASPKGETTKIIALTANVLEEEKTVVMEAGCDDFMRKPFRETEIFEMMSTHIGVNYVYEEERKTDEPEGIPSGEVLTAEAIKALPGEWVARLEEALLEGDLDSMASVTEEISSQNAPLAAALKTCLDNFEFDKVLSLL